MSGTDATGRLAAARTALPICASPALYLNHGGAGPLPAAALRAIEAELGRGALHGRGTLPTVERTERTAAALRHAVADLLGGRHEEVALTGNTTNGLNIALWGVAWRPGDEVITTALEHPGLSVPLGILAERHGVRLHHIPAAQARADLAGAVSALVGSRTRMVALSHVAYGTGEVLDVAGVAAAVAGSDALVVVDGAQSAGAIPVDVTALGVDGYAIPAHKWLYGPEGLGALWLSGRAQAALAPTYSGYESGSGHRPDGSVTLHRGARRHEVSTPPIPFLAGWLAALDWLSELGWAWIHSRIAAGQAAALTELAQVPGVETITPPGPQAGLLSFAIAGRDPVAACAALAADGVIVRWLGEPAALRASLGFHWCHSELTRLRAAVETVSGC